MGGGISSDLRLPERLHVHLSAVALHGRASGTTRSGYASALAVVLFVVVVRGHRCSCCAGVPVLRRRGAMTPSLTEPARVRRPRLPLEGRRAGGAGERPLVWRRPAQHRDRAVRHVPGAGRVHRADLVHVQQPVADQPTTGRRLASGELRRGVPQARRCRGTCSTPCMYAGLATVFTLLSSVPAAYALAKLRWRGRNARLPGHHLHDDAAAADDHGPAVPDVGRLPPDRYAVAADPADAVRRRVLHLPAAPVHADHPGRVPRRGPGGRLRRVADAAAGGRCRWPGPGIAATAHVPVLLRLERLLRPVPLHQREPEQLDAVAGPGLVPQPARTSTGTWSPRRRSSPSHP